MRTQDYTLTMILTLFSKAQSLGVSASITDTQINCGEFTYNYSGYRLDEAILDALLYHEKWFAMKEPIQK